MGIDEPEPDEDECIHEDADEEQRQELYDTGVFGDCGIRVVYRIRTVFCSACLRPLDQSFQRVRNLADV